jgi:hypothetical protein
MTNITSDLLVSSIFRKGEVCSLRCLDKYYGISAFYRFIALLICICQPSLYKFGFSWRPAAPLLSIMALLWACKIERKIVNSDINDPFYLAED